MYEMDLFADLTTILFAIVIPGLILYRAIDVWGNKISDRKDIFGYTLNNTNTFENRFFVPVFLGFIIFVISICLISIIHILFNTPFTILYKYEIIFFSLFLSLYFYIGFILVIRIRNIYKPHLREGKLRRTLLPLLFFFFVCSAAFFTSLLSVYYITDVRINLFSMTSPMASYTNANCYNNSMNLSGLIINRLDSPVIIAYYGFGNGDKKEFGNKVLGPKAKFYYYISDQSIEVDEKLYFYTSEGTIEIPYKCNASMLSTIPSE